MQTNRFGHSDNRQKKIDWVVKYVAAYPKVSYTTILNAMAREGFAEGLNKSIILDIKKKYGHPVPQTTAKPKPNVSGPWAKFETLREGE